MVLMISPGELLLHDARENLSRQIAAVSGKRDLDEAFVAWLLSEENLGVDLEGAAAVAAGHVGAERTYHDVAVLGFASAVRASKTNQATLNNALKWLAGRTPFVDGLPTGVCVDAVALLGIALGGKHVRDAATRRLIAAWIGSFIFRSYGMRNEEDWQKCLLAAAQRILRLSPTLTVPSNESISDVRVALYAKGLLVVPDGALGEQESIHALSLIKREAGTHIESQRAALRLAAFNWISRTASGSKLSQRIPAAGKVNQTAIEKVIKILFLTANPSDSTRLRLDVEFRTIDEKLRQAEFRDKFELKHHPGVRVSDIHEYLLRYNPDIVHFSGHGNAASEIILESTSGKRQPVPVRALSNLFAALKDNIRCVVLNACYSEQQAQAIAQHIECVVGMSKSISDAAAINFATAFYQGLAYGRDVQTAFNLGCVQIDLDNLNEQDTPKLLSPNSDPGRVVFV